jgi:hypothetical protein
VVKVAVKGEEIGAGQLCHPTKIADRSNALTDPDALVSLLLQPHVHSTIAAYLEPNAVARHHSLADNIAEGEADGAAIFTTW